MPIQADLRQAIYALSDSLDLVGVDDVAHGKRVGVMAAECAREIECYYPECTDRDVLAQNCPYSIIDTTRDCSDDVACPPDTGFCTAPGTERGCGICNNPPEEATCVDDRGCAAGSICEPLRCACQGQHVCVPGCASDAECDEGEACGANGRCAARACGGDDDCPADFRCDGGGCLRRACGGDDECSAACVGGRCFSEPGECTLPVP